MTVRSYARRRIGTVDGIEVHEGSKSYEVGFRGGSLIKMFGFGDAAFDAASGQFISRTEDGRIGGVMLADLEPQAGEMEILALEAIEPEMGHGRKLVWSYEEYARSKGASRIFLATRHEAYGFWVKMGYRLVPPPYKSADSSLNDIIEAVEIYTDDKRKRQALVKEIRKTKLVPDEMWYRPGLLPYPIVLEKELR